MARKNKKHSSVEFGKIISRLFSYMKEDKIKLVVVLLFAVCSTVFSIVSPKILGKATTEIFNGVVKKIQDPTAGIDFSYVYKISVLLIVLYILSALFSYIQSYIMSGIAQKVSYTLRREISAKFKKLPMSYFDKKHKGDIVSRITNDVDTLNQTLNQSLMQVITSIVTIIGVFAMMLSINVVMSLLALLIIPLTTALLGFVIRKSQVYFKDQQEYLGKMNGKIEEIFSGQSQIRGYNAERFEELEFSKINRKLYDTGWKSQFMSGVMMPIMTFIGNLGYALMAVVGGYMAINGKISVGDIQAFIQYIMSFTQPLNQMAQALNLLQSTAAAADRIFKFLDEEEVDLSSDKVLDEKRYLGDIEFKNVDFGYSEDQKIIDDFNLSIKSGQKVAIVGATGSGKTTLVKLLMRFYEPTKGSILIDGEDISSLDVKEYRKNFAMVFQEPWLFNGSIIENLRYGRLDASDEEVFAAAKAAYVDKFILTQKDGYDTVLREESSNISEGQKQLLTIARAILSNPKVLILDEATSSVDTRTEVVIQRAMDNLIRGKTSFIIAHRLSTVRNADIILVLENGRIIEKGSHDELIKIDGYYKKLYDSQYENLREVD